MLAIVARTQRVGDRMPTKPIDNKPRAAKVRAAKETGKCSTHNSYKPSSTCSPQSESSQCSGASRSCSGRCGCQAAKAGVKKCRQGGDTVKAARYRILKAGEIVRAGDEAKSAMNRPGMGYLIIPTGHPIVGSRVVNRIDGFRVRRRVKGGRK